MKENKNIYFDDKGNIVARNPLSNELPDITVTLKSGRTTYRFTAIYDGSKSLPSKILKEIKNNSENN